MRPFGVEQRRVEVAGLGDDRGARRAHHRDRHLVHDRVEAHADDLQRDRVVLATGGDDRAHARFSVRSMT